jgi:hypothetical protein
MERKAKDGRKERAMKGERNGNGRGRNEEERESEKKRRRY